MKPTNFRCPRTERLLRVQFRNGYVSRFEYQAKQLRWSDSGSPWDIVGAEYAGDVPDAVAWNPVSGGY